MTNWLVLKFGGTSVASAARWDTIADRARTALADGCRPLIVCSAVSGVTNLLERVPTTAGSEALGAVLAELRARHTRLVDEMGIAMPDAATALLDDVERLAAGISLVGEASPRVRARLMATGELLATYIGTAYLQKLGVDAGWLDARTVLAAAHDPSPGARRWLAAACDDDADPVVRSTLEGLPTQVLVTQGFIARTADGDTALLGRGGSDTSAAYFAAKLQAVRCEIWTDVPGMFTADPRLLPEARLLRRLDYDEAQEIASTGAKVLHPRAIGPVRRHNIPMTIRCTPRPELEPTVISRNPNARAPQVKALSSKRKVTMLSMESVGMWQEVGFLGDVFAVFTAHGLSVDLVSTSETNLTVTLDHGANPVDDAALEALAQDLERHCRTQVVRDLASVSLVGIGIRSILYRLGSVLEQFEEQPVHLVSQASNDLNFSLVIDPEGEEKMLRRLHGELFQGLEANQTFGPTWREMFGAGGAGAGPAARPRWWRDARESLLAEAAAGTPVYVYDEATVRASADALGALTSVDRVFYAMKANAHPSLLRTVASTGAGFECVSPGELARVADVLPGIASERLLYTPNFAPRADYAAGLDAGAWTTVDNLHPLEAWPELFAGREIFARIDVGSGKGHHKHVKTAGARSKFGIDPDELSTLRSLAARAGATIVGLHAHAGSGIHTPEAWREVAAGLAQFAESIPSVRYLDVGGGLGVPERPTQLPLDLKAVDAALAEVRAAFPFEELWVEPGRFFVAEAGVLLARVTQIKHKRDLTWIGVDAGMHTLIRPALYGAWHEIVNLTRLGEPDAITAQVVGPICESGDVLGRARRLPRTEEGDVLLVAVTGAYGRSMASEYNLRGLPREVVLPK